MTNQYAVTEFSHSVNPNKPDSSPGIFITYDIEPLSVRITKDHRGFIQFVTRTFGIIGGNVVSLNLGVFSTSGMCLRLFLKIRSYLQKQSSYQPIN